jgi:hypothetical protein
MGASTQRSTDGGQSNKIIEGNNANGLLNQSSPVVHLMLLQNNSSVATEE